MRGWCAPCWVLWNRKRSGNVVRAAGPGGENKSKDTMEGSMSADVLVADGSPKKSMGTNENGKEGAAFYFVDTEDMP